MILVTGTKRSGTSMWMQILDAGGFPIIGKAFLGMWADSIREANPRGFFESPYRQGVFYATNPDPRTGRYLRPDETRRHAVKVFVPGVIRTDIAYIDKVIATMRPWQVYVRSVCRLYALEDAHHATLPEEERNKARAAVARGRPRIPPEVEWWFEHYELVRDVATRRYPIHLTSYERVLEAPEAEIRKVFAWLGGGDVAAAASRVAPELHRSQHGEAVDCVLPDDTVALMDTLYARVHAERGLDEGLIRAMNEHQERIVLRWGTPSRERMREDAGVAESDRDSEARAEER